MAGGRDRRGQRVGWAAGALATALVVTAGLVPATAGAQATITPALIDFGAQALGTTSPPRLIELVNRGAQPFFVNRSELNSGPDNADFVATKDGCTGATLGPGETCSVELAFRPTTAGPTSQTFGFDVSGAEYETLGERVAVMTVNGTGTGTTPPVTAAGPAAASVPEGLWFPVAGVSALGLGMFMLATTRRGGGQTSH
ncbi:MAG TPA: choice-of-anchor D domain-containing protein [Acidimicrobiales bacterium]|nr:choice-of-anchor D domain-containing protein [Acidimicrobiales bacterium]